MKSHFSNWKRYVQINTMNYLGFLYLDDWACIKMSKQIQNTKIWLVVLDKQKEKNIYLQETVSVRWNTVSMWIIYSLALKKKICKKKFAEYFVT